MKFLLKPDDILRNTSRRRSSRHLPPHLLPRRQERCEAQLWREKGSPTHLPFCSIRGKRCLMKNTICGPVAWSIPVIPCHYSTILWQHVVKVMLGKFTGMSVIFKITDIPVNFPSMTLTTCCHSIVE